MQVIKKRYELFLSPLIVLVAVMWVFYGAQLYPFGSNALNWGDMAQQNFPVMIQLRDIMRGEQGPLFSMVNAGGMDFSGIFLFLASSPFSLLSVFFSKHQLVFFINIMILLKLMTCSVTASFFFHRYFKRLTPLQNCALSVSYALCGYSMMFYQLHTWLDVMYMFPLLLIAYDKLIKEHKIAPYTITLSLMILFQFYLGYMVALFIIFSFFLHILLVAKTDEKKKTVVFFAKGTLLAVLISAPVLITALEQYVRSARGTDVIEGLLNGKFFTAIPTTLPFMLATSFLFVTLPFIFILKIYKKPENKTVLFMYILMVIPVFIEPVNKLWHTGSYQAFPVRYGYITVMMGLCLAGIIISSLNDVNLNAVPKKFSLAIIAAVLLIIELYIFMKSFFADNRESLKSYATTLWGSDSSLHAIVINSLIAIFILMIFFFQYYFKRISRRAFSILICAFVFLEGVFNASVYIGFGARDTEKYRQVISLGGKIDDDSTYRVKVNNKYFDVNLTGAMGYNSLAHYTSLINNDYIFAMKKLGYSSYWMEVNSNGSTAFTDALLGNKYTIRNFYELNSLENYVYTDGYYYITINENNMSLGNVFSDTVIKDLEKIPDKNRIEFQQQLYSKLTGRDNNLITRYNFTDSAGASVTETDDGIEYRRLNENIGFLTYEIDVKGRQNLYFDCFNELSTRLNEPINNSFNIVVNGIRVASYYPNKNTNGMLDLGIFENEKVEIIISVLRSGRANSFGVFGVDLDELSMGVKNVRPAEVRVDGDTINASAVTDEDDQMLLLTIPYNKGFDIYVNDKPVDAKKVLDAFMAIPLEKGENTVTLKYRSYGMGFGIIIGLIGIVLLLFSIWRSKKKEYKRIAWLENILYYGFNSVAILVFAIIYIAPVAVYLVYNFILR